MRRLAFAVAALLSLAAACHTTTEPALLEEFQLVSIDGRPLPTTRTTGPTANGVLVLSETLALDGQGVATRSTTVQGATPSEPVTSTVSYAYTKVGDVVTLGNVLCGPGALCILHVPEAGPIDGATLTLSPTQSVPVPSPVLVYQRVPLIG